MNTLVNSTLAAVLLAALPVAAQQPGHTMPMGQPPGVNAEQLTACVQSQQQTMALVDAANQRLEMIRQKNNPALMREALDEFQTTLSGVRARLAPCAQFIPAASTGIAMDHAAMGHTMPGAANMKGSPAAPPATPVMQPGSTQPAPGAANPTAPAPAGAVPTPSPHAGHVMPGAAAMPTMPRSAPPGTPPPPSGGMPMGGHAGHAMPATGGDSPLIKDPRCTAPVDALTAPRASYEGRNYYFCSESDRQLFVTDPARYLRGTSAMPRAPASGAKPQAGDPHVGHTMTTPTAPTKAPPTAKPSADPHAGHTMAPAPAAKPPAATTKPGAAKPAGDPHAGHTMPADKPKTPETSKAPAGAKPTTPAAPMDHSKMPMGGAPKKGDETATAKEHPKLPVMPAERIADPACPNNVGDPKAPTAVYQRKVYYFCSTKDRDEFRKDPAAYLKKRPR